MHILTRRTILLAAACSNAAFLITTRFAEAAAPLDDASALAFVSAIYKNYTTGRKDGVRIDSGPKLRHYFEPALAETMIKDQETAAKHHEVGELDGDPFVDAQDYDIKRFDIAVKSTEPGKATATVTLENFGKQQTIVLELVAIKNDWRIYDILWPRDGKTESLRGLFRFTR